MRSDLARLCPDFTTTLLHWYHLHKRELPWRNTHDPYQIWLSEVILQQTRVAQGLPYFERFMSAYPSVFALAEASEEEVLRLWQGLGYYSRARNMRHTAQQIVRDFGGQFPSTYQELLQLRGVGAYTAAAIASFAYNEAVPAIDGNVYRVLARVFGIETDIRSPGAHKAFWQVAAALLPAEQAGVFNQALMEFGAIQCRPVSPDCIICPLQIRCVAFSQGTQKVLPIKKAKTRVRDRFLSYFVLQHKDKLAMQARTSKDIWQGLYDFLLSENDQLPDSPEASTLPDDTLRWLLHGTLLGHKGPLIHLLSHQRLHVQFWQVALSDSLAESLPEGLRWYAMSEVSALPKPILIESYLRETFFV